MKRDRGNGTFEQELYEREATFEQSMREMIRETMLTLMSEEVESLCGIKHESREGKVYFRGGSEKGHVIIENESHGIVRPRIRKNLSNGKTEEARLKSFEVARSRRSWSEKMFDLVQGGMSQRSVEKLD